MASRFSHGRLIFFVPYEGKLIEPEGTCGWLANSAFKQALRKENEFVELEGDEDENGNPGYLVVFEVANSNQNSIDRITKLLDKIVANLVVKV